MTQKKNILILPSWYASRQWPTSGSFFREQSLLMAEDYEISVAVSEKFWISRQRFFYHRWFKKPYSLAHKPLDIQPPSGHTVVYPFCKYASDEENLQSEINAYVRYIQNRQLAGPIELIHAHSSHTAGIVAHGIAQQMGLPYIITEHYNPFILSQFPAFWQQKIRLALENASEVLAVSEHQRQNILMNGIACNPLVVGNLTDDQAFTLPTTQHPTSKIKFIIVTYYPNFIKDMGVFFEALAILKEKKLDSLYEFTIVGGGELSGEYTPNYYQDIISRQSLAHFVRVVPSASRTEMVDLMHTSDAIISCSIAESFGVAICEAMLCGKPAITTLNGGINDFANESNSIRVRIHDANALAEGIITFQANRESFNAATIRNSIVSKYGQKVFRERIKQIYETVLHRHSLS